MFSPLPLARQTAAAVTKRRERLPGGLDVVSRTQIFMEASVVQIENLSSEYDDIVNDPALLTEKFLKETGHYVWILSLQSLLSGLSRYGFSGYHWLNYLPLRRFFSDAIYHQDDRQVVLHYLSMAEMQPQMVSELERPYDVVHGHDSLLELFVPEKAGRNYLSNPEDVLWHLDKHRNPRLTARSITTPDTLEWASEHTVIANLPKLYLLAYRQQFQEDSPPNLAYSRLLRAAIMEARSEQSVINSGAEMAPLLRQLAGVIGDGLVDNPKTMLDLKTMLDEGHPPRWVAWRMLSCIASDLESHGWIIWRELEDVLGIAQIDVVDLQQLPEYASILELTDRLRIKPEAGLEHPSNPASPSMPRSLSFGLLRAGGMGKILDAAERNNYQEIASELARLQSDRLPLHILNILNIIGRPELVRPVLDLFPTPLQIDDYWPILIDASQYVGVDMLLAFLSHPKTNLKEVAETMLPNWYSIKEEHRGLLLSIANPLKLLVGDELRRIVMAWGTVITRVNYQGEERSLLLELLLMDSPRMLSVFSDNILTSIAARSGDMPLLTSLMDLVHEQDVNSLLMDGIEHVDVLSYLLPKSSKVDINALLTLGLERGYYDPVKLLLPLRTSNDVVHSFLAREEPVYVDIRKLCLLALGLSR